MSMYCVNHPNTETYLRCGKCDKPICADCMLIGPAGTRCKECASVRSSPLYNVPVDRLALGVVAGLAVATACGFVMAAAFRFGFFLFWLGFFAGYGVGETILRLTNRKRGPKIEAAAGVCAGLGSIAGLLLYFLYSHWE